MDLGVDPERDDLVRSRDRGRAVARAVRDAPDEADRPARLAVRAGKDRPGRLAER